MLENGIETYAALGLIIALAVWGHDLAYHPLPRLSRALGIGYGWWLMALVAIAYPVQVLWQRRFSTEHEKYVGQRMLALNGRAARMNLASRLWAETLRDACADTPERTAALRALDAATEAAMAALYRRAPV